MTLRPRPSSFPPAASLVLLVGVMALGACAKQAAPVAAAPARTVSVTTVTARALAGGLTASGLLVSREEAAVYPQVTGYPVAQVLVEAGARVAKGQPLALLDDTLLRAQIDQTAALVAQQQIATDQAAAQAQRIEGLEGQGVLSVEQMDQRRFQARGAKAALAAQQAQLNDLKVRDARMVIRAPVAGLVLERDVRPGDIAAQGSSPMFRMARDSLVELSADTPEADLGAIRVGDPVRVTLSDGTTIAGAVRLIQPSIDATTKLGKVLIRLPVREDLRPGGFASAVFAAGARQAPSVPETAIRYDADGASVMVVDGDDRVSETPVKTGAHAGGYVELTQGPPIGARVLRAAASFVLPGDRIIPSQDAR